jgi:signal-transduction protein with cAMP-binding, CBS, and nucleotidyltransferase domain
MLISTEISSSIKAIPWFLDLEPKDMQKLAEIAELKSFVAEEIIFKEGQQHPYIYVILEGSVQLESFIPGHGVLPVYTAESLDVIGWSSLTPVVRQKTSSARVLKNTKAICFHSESLMNLCESECEIGFVIMRRIANIVASRFLNHRLHLLELIASHAQ